MANPLTDLSPVDISASAVLTKGNTEVTILVTECPNSSPTSDTGSTFEAILHVSEVEPEHGLWSTIGQSFGTDRAAASKQFDVWLDSYKSQGFVFTNYED